MNAVLAIVLGLSFGTGLVLVGTGLRTRPTPLRDLDTLLSRPGVSIAAGGGRADGPSDDLRSRVGRAGTGFVNRVGIDIDELDARLRILDKSTEQHVYEKLLAASAGFGLPIVASFVITAADVAVNPIVVLALSTVLAAAGFVYPDLPLADQVAARRREFRHSLSSFLDLVTIIMAGGGGIETALTGAADAGEGWPFEQLRDALRRSRMTRRTPWETLSDLGEELGIDELAELAASVSLAGGHGARVKDSLTAKADALRSALAAETEAASESQTEKMILPVMVMIFGLVLFIGYGAVDAISTPADGLSPVPAVEAEP